MFAQRLKELRTQKSLTQVTFADLLKVSAGTVAMWETGKRTPDAYTLKRIADYFKVTVDSLIGDTVLLNFYPTASAKAHFFKWTFIFGLNAEKCTVHAAFERLSLCFSCINRYQTVALNINKSTQKIHSLKPRGLFPGLLLFVDINLNFIFIIGKVFNTLRSSFRRIWIDFITPAARACDVI